MIGPRMVSFCNVLCNGIKHSEYVAFDDRQTSEKWFAQEYTSQQK